MKYANPNAYFIWFKSDKSLPAKNHEFQLHWIVNVVYFLHDMVQCGNKEHYLGHKASLEWYVDVAITYLNTILYILLFFDNACLFFSKLG